MWRFAGFRRRALGLTLAALASFVVDRAEAQATAESYARTCSVCHSPTKPLDHTNAGRIEYMYGSRAGSVVWNPSDKLKSLGLVWDRKNLEAMMRRPRGYMITNPALRHSVPEQMIGPLIDHLAAIRKEPPASEQAARADFDKWRSRAGIGAPQARPPSAGKTVPPRTPARGGTGEPPAAESPVENVPTAPQTAEMRGEFYVRQSCAVCHSRSDAIFFENLYGAKAGANTRNPSPELTGSGIVWSESTLAQLLTEPKGVVTSQFQIHHRMGSAWARDIAAYLKSKSQ